MSSCLINENIKQRDRTMRKSKMMFSGVLVFILAGLSFNLTDLNNIYAQDGGDAPRGTVEDARLHHHPTDEFKTVTYWCGTTTQDRCFYGSGYCDVAGQPLCNN